MRPLGIVAFVQIALLVFCVPLHAGPIVGSQVTGQLFVVGDTSQPNRFDPSNSLASKQPKAYLNIGGTTVTISATQAEFGYLNSVTPFTSADFNGNQLIVSLQTITGSSGFTMIFTDTAFLGASLTKGQDNFINGGVAGNLVDNTITVSWVGSLGVRQKDTTTWTAIFDLSPATDPASSPALTAPEPSSLVLFTLFSAAGVVAWRRRSRR